MISFDVFSVANSIDADIAFADPPVRVRGMARLLELLKVDVLIAESGRAIEPVGGLGAAAQQAVRPRHGDAP